MSTPAAELFRRIGQAFTGPPEVPSGRKRILVSAYTLSPRRGSEPAVGWHVASRLAAFHDVTVLTSPEVEGEDYRTETLRHLDAHPVPGLKIHYVEPPTLARKLMVPNAPAARLLYYVGYAAWQRAALREARGLHTHKPFDLVHQLNMIGYREPGYLWSLDAPFVWGPIGGASMIPPSYFSTMGLKEAGFYAVRNVANVIQRYTASRCWRAAAKAKLIWYVSSAEQQLVEKTWRSTRGEQLLESGTTPQPRATNNYDGQRPLRLVWSGLHIGRKALPLLIEALAKVKHRCKVELSVLGDGPQTARWDTLAVHRGVNHMIQWRGRLPRDQAMAEMARADALAFTSVSEGSPHVVLEALAMGLPVICHDSCGMGVAVDNTCGIKIPMVDTATSVDGFAAAIVKLAANPAEVEKLGAGATRRGQELTWDAVVAQLCRGYDRVLSDKVHVSNPAGQQLGSTVTG